MARSARRTTRRRRHRDESGAIMVVTAFAVVLIVTIAAFAVDLGLQRSAVRDMQAVADAAALDAARQLPSVGCAQEALEEAALASVQRQGGVIGDGVEIAVRPGHLDPVTKKFSAGPRSGACDAVEVEASTTVFQAFAGGEGGATRSAVGTQDLAAVCFSAGTKALTLNTAESALAPALKYVLGTHLNLSVASWEGLVNVKDFSISMLDLQVQLKTLTGKELLDLPVVRLSDLMLASANVLRQNGNLAQAQVLEALRVSAGAINVDLGKVLDLSTGGNTALEAGIDVFGLISTSIYTANGVNGLVIPGVSLGLGPIANLNGTSVRIIEPPKIACGGPGATAKTAQVSLNLGLNLLPGNGYVLDVADIRLDLSIPVAAATVKLGSPMTCLDATGHGSVPMSANISTVSATGDLTIGVLGLLGLRVAEVTAKLGLNVGGATPTFSFAIPPSPPLTQTVPSSTSANLNLTTSDVAVRLLGGLFSLPLTTATSLVTQVVNGVVSPVLSALVSPLLGALGIKLGQAEVTLLSAPECSGVRLAG